MRRNEGWNFFKSENFWNFTEKGKSAQNELNNNAMLHTRCSSVKLKHIIICRCVSFFPLLSRDSYLHNIEWLLNLCVCITLFPKKCFLEGLNWTTTEYTHFQDNIQNPNAAYFLWKSNIAIYHWETVMQHMHRKKRVACKLLKSVGFFLFMKTSKHPTNLLIFLLHKRLCFYLTCLYSIAQKP